MPSIRPWIDHLSPWTAFLAIASSGAFSVMELSGMATPLAGAAILQALNIDASPYRRKLEISAALLFACMLAFRLGLIPITLNTFFILCGIRLALPRKLPQKRQIFLIAFLLYLSTTIHSPGPVFLLWSIAWISLAAITLATQSWDATADQTIPKLNIKKSALSSVFGFTVSVLLTSLLIFFILPRNNENFRFLWQSLQSKAGLGNSLDLTNSQPIQSSGEEVLRIVPTKGNRAAIELTFALMKGFALERFTEGRWEIDPTTPDPYKPAPNLPPVNLPLQTEFYFEPNTANIIPRPYAQILIIKQPQTRIENGTGHSLRWYTESNQPVTLSIQALPPPNLEMPRDKEIRPSLLYTGNTPAPLKWSRSAAPQDLPARQLVKKLEQNLRTFRYTLDNPSGKAKDPLQDFLEVSRAGHCEYFASALALALRHRGVPARVILGYRLGSWVATGGYWIVTQDEAHSWVEFFDAERGVWSISDPTPGSIASKYGQNSFLSACYRLADTARFKWDHFVIGFSPNSQLAGLTWLQSQVSSLPVNPLMIKLSVASLLAFLILYLLIRFHRRCLLDDKKWILPEIKPLIRTTKKEFPVNPDDTFITWCQKVSQANPGMKEKLDFLSHASTQAVYGRGDKGSIPKLVQELICLYRNHRSPL